MPFYTEQQAVEAIAIPEGWSFRDAAGQLAFPNAMQRWTAWQVREKQRVGNWSGTGAGKTLAAYPESVVLTRAHRLSTAPHDGNTPIYLMRIIETKQTLCDCVLDYFS